MPVLQAGRGSRIGGRFKGDLREVWTVNLPIVKAYKHWAERATREVRRLK